MKLLVKMPPIHKVWSWNLPGQGGHPDHMSTLPVPGPFPTLNTFQFIGRHSRLKTGLEQAKWNGSFLTSSWLSWWSWTLLPSFPAMSICEDDLYLLQCLILSFLAWDMPSQRLKTAILVMVAARYGPLHGQKCQNGRNFPPPRTVILVAWWWAKKIYISSTLAKVMGVQSSTYQKIVQKCQIWM